MTIRDMLCCHFNWPRSASLIQKRKREKEANRALQRTLLIAHSSRSTGRIQTNCECNKCLFTFIKGLSDMQFTNCESVYRDPKGEKEEEEVGKGLKRRRGRDTDQFNSFLPLLLLLLGSRSSPFQIVTNQQRTGPNVQ